MSSIPKYRSTFHMSRTIYSGTVCLNTRSYKSQRNLKNVDAFNSMSAFDHMEYKRAEEASRCILVQHRLHRNPEYVLQFCEQFGPVNKMYTYTSMRDRDNKQRYFALVEYNDDIGVTSMLRRATHFPSGSVVSLASRYLFYHHPILRENTTHKYRKSDDRKIITSADETLQDVDLLCANSVSEQLMTIYNQLRMSELAVRLRFFLASSLEESLQQFLPGCKLALFGSSVNGFGKNDGDLDLVLKVSETTQGQRADFPRQPQMYFMSKVMEADGEKSHVALDMVGSLMQYMFPQYYRIQKILSARIPIIKFSHSGTNLECDLSMSNDAAVDMSRYLYHLSIIDNRVAPLVFTVRLWAKSNQVTYPNPGGWLSNFMLTLLVMHFLQVTRPPVLPSLQAIDGEVKAKRVISRSAFNLGNGENLVALLLQFFAYYSTFDFSTTGISIQSASLVPKPEGCVMYIENPTELGSNVCRNVSQVYVGVFQDACQESLKTFQAAQHDSRSVTTAWGVMKVLSLQPVLTAGRKLNTKVGNLFEDQAVSSNENTTPDDETSPTVVAPRIDQLFAEEETPHTQQPSEAPNGQQGLPLDLSESSKDKHPVNLLIELCLKKRWQGPHFVLVQDTGPEHAKEYQYKVIVNGQTFVSTSVSNSKKKAKTSVAEQCLQELNQFDTRSVHR